MKSAKQTRTAGRLRPSGTGRHESAGRVGRRSDFSYEKSESEWSDTGVFHTPRPEVVGVSDDVRVATRNLARSAKKAEATWERRLSETTEGRLRREARERVRRDKSRRRNKRRSGSKSLPKGV